MNQEYREPYVGAVVRLPNNRQGLIVQWDRENHCWLVEVGYQTIEVRPSELKFDQHKGWWNYKP